LQQRPRKEKLGVTPSHANSVHAFIALALHYNGKHLGDEHAVVASSGLGASEEARPVAVVVALAVPRVARLGGGTRASVGVEHRWRGTWPKGGFEGSAAPERRGWGVENGHANETESKKLSEEACTNSIVLCYILNVILKLQWPHLRGEVADECP